jgi:hypothetical protein
MARCVGEVMSEEGVRRQELEQAIAVRLRLSLNFTSWASYGPTFVPPGELDTTCR